VSDHDQFVEEIVRALRALSPDLVEAGVAATVAGHADRSTAGSLTVLLRQVETLIRLTPVLADNLEPSESNREEQYPTRLPRGARLARTPRSYEMRDGSLLPKEWLRPEPILEADLRPLGFLLYLLETTDQNVADAETRTAKYLEDALPARDVASGFARAEAAALVELRASIRCARSDLARSTHLVKARAGYRLNATPLFPKPYPRLPVWSRLRRLAAQILDPRGALPSSVRHLLALPIHVADVPFLYQRWCGVQLLAALESLGWTVMRERVSPLFLGGPIPLKKDGITIVLWVEPRLTSRGSHPSALYSVRDPEASPDFVLVTPGPGGSDAYVLDPTTSSDPAVRASKSRYLANLAFDELHLVAGNPVLHSPLRAWAAAPIGSRQCVLGSADGRSGTIPMHPVGFDAAPLQSWLGNVEDHALAWGRHHLHRGEAPHPTLESLRDQGLV